MVYIFLALVFFTLVVVTGAVASRTSLNVNIIVAIENLISALIPIALSIPLVGKVSVQNQKFAVLIAILEGIFVTFYVIFLTKSYATNKVAIVAPIVFGGAIFLSAIISYFVFKEKISYFQGIGLALLFAGLIFITYARLTGK